MLHYDDSTQINTTPIQAKGPNVQQQQPPFHTDEPVPSYSEQNGLNRTDSAQQPKLDTTGLNGNTINGHAKLVIKLNAWMLTGDPQVLGKLRLPRQKVGKDAVFDPDWMWCFPDKESAEKVAQKYSQHDRKLGVQLIYSDIARMTWHGTKHEKKIAKLQQKLSIEGKKANDLNKELESTCYQYHFYPCHLEEETPENFNDEQRKAHELLQPKFKEWKTTHERCIQLERDIDELKSNHIAEACASPTDSRQTIRIVPGELHIITSATEEALIKDSSGIYQRGGQLVKIIEERSRPKLNGNKSTIKRADDAWVITNIDHIYLAECMCKSIRWEKYDGRAEEWKMVDAPEKIAKTLIAHSQWDFPYLTGIIQAPTLRHDGSILEQPGYDADTGLFFGPGLISFPSLPTSPTYEDAIAAMDKLLSLISGFPFENEESKSVAISAILTGLIRRSIKTAPLHGFSAPKMGSGKSLLADVVGLIATGKPNTVVSQAPDETEEKKRLLTVLIEGDPIVCYDNIERPLSSSALCSILTQERYKDRVLGVSKNISVSTNALFLATGNNLVIQGDLSTRALLCRLDPQCECPEEREFQIDLHDHIPKHRGELVQAALTILLAYHVAGRPKQSIKPFGRFEEWSDWVRSAIVWVGVKDPCASRKEIESSDPERMSLGNLLSAWYSFFGDFAQTIKKVVNNENEALKDALNEFTSNRHGEANTVSLGIKLQKYDKRIEGGYQLQKGQKVHNSVTWRVVKVKN